MPLGILRLYSCNELFLGCICRLQHFLHCYFQLGIDTLQGLIRLIVDFDVRLELVVFCILTAHVYTSYLWNTEDDAWVDLSFPPNGCHGSWYGGAD